MNACDSYSITPIVVFDGSRRVSAKSRELERRLNARQLLAGRAETVRLPHFALSHARMICTCRGWNTGTYAKTLLPQEEARTTRLRELKGITSALQDLSANERAKTLEQTQKMLDSATTTEEVTPDLASITSPTAQLSARFAQLTLSMQATSLSDAHILSKRQHAIAQGEAKAFMQALTPSAVLTEDQEDPLEALQSVLDESTVVAEGYGRRSTPVTKQTYTDCMVCPIVIHACLRH